ncbi:hypothetical protein AN643_04220 [Candidatus Epulonipiscioides saccharophilum]|nr:hypothetical protein AN643_04220 [Epulopiscium sp. SCG-B10WGA-EpuloB]
MKDYTLPPSFNSSSYRKQNCGESGASLREGGVSEIASFSEKATEKIFLYQEILTLNQPAPLVISSIKMKQYKLAQGFSGGGVSYRNDDWETM